MSTPDVPHFDPAPKAPKMRAPAGACDCHMHIFGPAASYPWSPERGYTPPDALLGDYQRLRDVLGIERVVVVQPSVYGTDNACTLDAVEALGDAGRGVAVLSADVDDATLDRLDAAGFCGNRFNAVSKGGGNLDGIARMAARLAERGWHLQFYINRDLLVAEADLLKALPVDIVFDHFAAVDPAAGLDQPAFKILLDLLDGGRAWVKISGAYRVDTGPAPWPAATPFAKALVGHAPERLVWGTDWPHPGPAGPMPNDGDLLDALIDWTEDKVVLQKILVDNPARLYGFP